MMLTIHYRPYGVSYHDRQGWEQVFELPKGQDMRQALRIKDQLNMDEQVRHGVDMPGCGRWYLMLDGQPVLGIRKH